MCRRLKQVRGTCSTRHSKRLRIVKLRCRKLRVIRRKSWSVYGVKSVKTKITSTIVVVMQRGSERKWLKNWTP